MKIIFLIRSLEVGGAEHQMAMLSSKLAESGFDVKVLVFYQKGAFQEMLQKAHVQVLTLNKKSRWDLLGPLVRLFKICKQEKPDIVYSFLPVANLLAIALHYCLPKIKAIWGVRASNMELKHYDWLSRLVSKIESMLSHYANAIIVNSYRGQTEMQRLGFKNKSMMVIPNGINVEKFSPDTSKREKIRKEWQVKESEYLIGHVARLDPMKDHETFCKAAALLSKRLDNVRFVCIGEGSYTYLENLKALASRLGLQDKLIWAGMRKDVEDVYNAFDLFCSSSAFGEGFSNVLGEAMSMGIPCVATDVGDAAFILGDMGYVVPARDAKALAEACYKALTLKNISRDGIRNRVVENFSLATMVERTKCVFEKLCASMETA